MLVIRLLTLASVTVAVLYPNTTSTVSTLDDAVPSDLAPTTTSTSAPETTPFYCPPCWMIMLYPAQAIWTTDTNIPDLATTYITVNAATNATSTSVKCNSDVVTANTWYPWGGNTTSLQHFYFEDNCKLGFRMIDAFSLGEPSTFKTAYVESGEEYLALGNDVQIWPVDGENGVSMTLPDGSLTCLTQTELGITDFHPLPYTDYFTSTVVTRTPGAWPRLAYEMPFMAKYFPGQEWATQCSYINFQGLPQTLTAANYFTVVTTISAGIITNTRESAFVPGPTSKPVTVSTGHYQPPATSRAGDPLAIAQPAADASNMIPSQTPLPVIAPAVSSFHEPAVPASTGRKPATPTQSPTASISVPIPPVTTSLIAVPAIIIGSQPAMVSSAPVTIGKTTVSLGATHGTTFAVIDSPGTHTTVPVAAIAPVLGQDVPVRTATALSSGSATLRPNDGSVLTVVDDTVPGGYTQILALDSPSTAPNAAPTLHVIAQAGNVRAYLGSHPELLAPIVKLLQQLQSQPGTGASKAALDLSTPGAVINAYVRLGTAIGIASNPAQLAVLVAAARVEEVLASAIEDGANDLVSADSARGPQRDNSVIVSSTSLVSTAYSAHLLVATSTTSPGDLQGGYIADTPSSSSPPNVMAFAICPAAAMMMAVLLGAVLAL